MPTAGTCSLTPLAGSPPSFCTQDGLKDEPTLAWGPGRSQSPHPLSVLGSVKSESPPHLQLTLHVHLSVSLSPALLSGSGSRSSAFGDPGRAREPTTRGAGAGVASLRRLPRAALAPPDRRGRCEAGAGGKGFESQRAPRGSWAYGAGREAARRGRCCGTSRELGVSAAGAGQEREGPWPSRLR